MPKTPDEIKKGMECCVIGPSAHQPKCGECPYKFTPMCSDTFLKDALALIQQLQKDKADLLEERELNDYLRDRVKQLEAERDAAVADLKELANKQGVCFGCKWYTGERCSDPVYKIICSFHADKWEWRGVQKEE